MHGKTLLTVLTLLVLFASSASAAEIRGTVRVIDGDTLQVRGTRIRLHGIDAPETGQTCWTEQGTSWACGVWVTEQARQRLEGRAVTCSPLDIDRYGRTVARCFHDGADVAENLISDGLAFAYLRYSKAYAQTERDASARDAGLHAMRIQSPAQFRQNRSASSVSSVQGCVIKGNISASGSRIYHMPGQRDYGRTRISKNRGERWFCSEVDAMSAGWRRAKR